VAKLVIGAAGTIDGEAGNIDGAADEYNENLDLDYTKKFTTVIIRFITAIQNKI
jgi:hypothetical protein